MKGSITPRIAKETQMITSQEGKVPGITVKPNEKNLRHFIVDIEGPPNSPYEGGVFKAELYLPDEYPMNPPKVVFCTKIYHPNIDNHGRICLDILKSKWSPALKIADDPLNNQAAAHWKQNENGALQEAKRMTKQYAIKD